MMKGRPGGCFAYIVGILSVLGAVTGWSEFLFKPLTADAPVMAGGPLAVIGDLLLPVPTIYGWPLAGYLLIFSTILLLILFIVLIMRPVRWSLNYLDISEAPVSILESSIELKMLDLSLETCRITRNQRLHANQPKVDAYHYSQSSLSGAIDSDSIDIKSRIAGVVKTRDLLRRAQGSTVEIIERFIDPLPTSRLLTYLPNSMVRFLADQFGWFSSKLVVREAKSIDINEYNGKNPIYQLVAFRYPSSKISICLNFPEQTAPEDDDVLAFVIKAHAVQNLPVIPDTSEAGRKKYRVALKSLKQQQTIRLQWSNERLEKLRSASPHLFIKEPA